MKLPPKALIETWVKLLHSTESDEVKTRAREMIRNTFPDPKALIEYCQRQGIAIPQSD